MRSIYLLLGAWIVILHASYAQSTSGSMTRIVMRDTSPGVPWTSLAAQPRTLYRLGETYGRVEEEPDPDRAVPGLVIVAEPKIWIINLRDRTGRLLVDSGPSHVFHAPVLPPEGPGQEQPLRDFEYGREYEFLSAHHALQGSETVDGTSYDKLSLAIGGFTISLLSHAGEERPYRLSVVKGEKLVLQVDYDDYRRDLEPNMNLFEPPQDIRLLY